jgi:hypothetical protein
MRGWRDGCGGECQGPDRSGRIRGRSGTDVVRRVRGKSGTAAVAASVTTNASALRHDPV